MTVYISRADAGEALAHHGVKGMHWGIRHDRERTKTTAAPKTKSERVGRIRNGGRVSEVSGKQYKQSRATAKAAKRYMKAQSKAARKPTVSNLNSATQAQYKYNYENARDIGRTSGTRRARVIGAINSVSAVPLIGIGLASGSAAAPLVAASLGIGGVALVKGSKAREYNRGMQYKTGMRRVTSGGNVYR